MTKGIRPAWRRYGLAILLFAAILAISLGLSALSIKISLSLLFVIAIVSATLYGGWGPGVMLATLIQGRMMYMNWFPPETPVGQTLFGYISWYSLLGFLVFIVSGLKNKAGQLRQQRELLRVTLSSIGDAVITTDTSGAINFLNPTARQLTGWYLDTAIGKPLEQVFKLVDEETGQPVRLPAKMVENDTTYTGTVTNLVLVPLEGGQLPIEHQTTPIVDSENRRIGTVIVFRDISARNAAAEALMESEHRLQQSQKMEAIGTLTGGVAHDFNNLLTAILGYAQLAKKRAQTGKPVEPLLEEVEKAGNRAASLTRQLLAFSRRQRLEPRNISVTETVGEIFKMLERIIGADVEIMIKHEPDVAPIFADPAQIEQVIINLSVNARDAMPGGGRLIIETCNVQLDEFYCNQYPDVEPGGYVQIRITDTGVGMDADTQARIFEPFFTTKDINKGTGLGLSMAYGIVKQHGGHISVYSEPGQGSSFNVFLPVAEQSARQKSDPAEMATEGGSETVLIAEDEEMLRNLSKDLLESLGYRVLLAKNGEEALELFERESDSIDILLFDVVMPAMGGLEAYETIHANSKKDVPIIFMTGYSPEFVQDKFIRTEQLSAMPAAKVIQKPYTLDALGRAVREALGKDSPAGEPGNSRSSAEPARFGS
jgi:two-component system, cell cycle sensor histidine kinase and response regulator CckA